MSAILVMWRFFFVFENFSFENVTFQVQIIYGGNKHHFQRVGCMFLSDINYDSAMGLTYGPAFRTYSEIFLLSETRPVVSLLAQFLKIIG